MNLVGTSSSSLVSSSVEPVTTTGAGELFESIDWDKVRYDASAVEPKLPFRIDRRREAE